MKRVRAIFTRRAASALSLALLLAACGSAETATVDPVASASSTPAATSAPGNAATAGPETSEEASAESSSDEAAAAPTETAPSISAAQPSAEDAASLEPDEDHPVPGRPEITRQMLEDAVARKQEEQ